MSLAGTKSESDNKQWNKKNNVEHSVVTNFIVSQLTSLGLNPIVGNASELRFNDIVHLKHDISVTGKIDADTIFRTLSPTPAVCGYPRDKARDFIAAHEGFDRDLYAGMIGTIGNNGQLNLYVNLRCAQQICSGDISKYMLYAGGGINQLSEAVDEWNETTAKMESLKHAITK